MSFKGLDGGTVDYEIRQTLTGELGGVKRVIELIRTQDGL